jgi:hypothetical protein
LTSAAPADTEADGDRCRCGRNCSAADVVKPEAVWRIASDWQKADQRHQAARTALRAFARSIDEVALRSGWPPIPLHRPGRDRRSTASTAAPFGRPECGSWADRPLFAGDRALRRSHGSGGVAKTRERRLPHRSHQAASRAAQPQPRSPSSSIYKWRQWDHLKEERRRTEIETQRRASVADLYE